MIVRQAASRAEFDSAGMVKSSLLAGRHLFAGLN